MAEKRCISRKIADSDSFTDLNLTTQGLYFHLNLNADDDGFINNSKKIMKVVGATERDFNELINKRFIIYFEEEGVAVIKHWWIHNSKRKDRHKVTEYTELYKRLTIKENGVYTLATNCQPSGNQLSPKVKETKEKEKKVKKFIPPTLAEIEEYCRSRNSSVNPKVFYDYFTCDPNRMWIDSKGNQVKNWKAKIITWEGSREKKEEDILPTYSTEHNKTMSTDEEKELMELMKGKK